jgi:hypothetical protein
MLLQYKENLFSFFLIILFLYNREKQSSSSNHRERESLQTNVRHLVYENKNECLINYIHMFSILIEKLINNFVMRMMLYVHLLKRVNQAITITITILQM